MKTEAFPPSTVQELDDEHIRNWQMPEVFVGQDVLWFQGGDRNSSFVRCSVVNVLPRGVTLRAQGTVVMTSSTESVRHVDDPILVKKPKAKQNDGAWDFLPIDVHRKFILDGLAAKLAILEERVAALHGVPLNSEDEEIEILRTQLAGAGIKTDRRSSLATLRAKVREMGIERDE